jgi:hypothetical protein
MILPQLRVQGIQDAVNEGTRIFGTEFFAEVDGFVESHLGGDPLAVEKLVDGKPQDVPVHSCHALKGPVLRAGADQLIDLIPVVPRPLDEFRGEIAGIRGSAEVTPEKIEGFPGIDSQDIELIKNL